MMTWCCYIGVYMNTAAALPLCFCLSSVRTLELKHEQLCDSVVRAEDAAGRTGHMEERSGSGRALNLSVTLHHVSR